MKRDKARAPAFTLPVPFPVSVPGFCWHCLMVEAAQDRYMAARFLYRLWKLKPDNIVALAKYMIAKGTIRTACMDEDDDPAGVRAWIEKHVLKYADADADKAGA